MHRLFKHHLTCLHFISAKRNPDSSVILVTRLLWNRVSILYSRTKCSLPRFTLAVVSPQPPIQRLLGGSLPGIKAAGPSIQPVPSN